VSDDTPVDEGGPVSEGEPAGEVPAGGLPSLTEALAWRGSRLDDARGRPAGRVVGVFVDTGSGEPAWLVAALGARGARRLALRRRSGKTVVVSVRECAALPGRVWSAQVRDAMGSAPAVDPARPLLREHELTICSHYGIGERVGRAAEVAGRPEGSVTSQPAH
jgi:hypothetical protein